MRNQLRLLLMVILVLFCGHSFAQEAGSAAREDSVRPAVQEPVSTGDLDRFFDDKLLIEGYAAKLGGASKETLLFMINDDSLNTFKKAATVRVFRETYGSQVVGRERAMIERMMLRQLERVNSVFVQIELMHVLLIMDRYRYFDAMIPVLIRKMEHYDPLVDDLAYKALDNVLNIGTTRTREARIVFNTLRKMFFLSRKKLQGSLATDVRLRNRLQVLRWAIKILGTEELRNLPKEVISLM